jgi:Peptidase family S41/N-terminal domain of Peptidase_S41 in eukaryotic IRBP
MARGHLAHTDRLKRPTASDSRAGNIIGSMREAGGIVSTGPFLAALLAVLPALSLADLSVPNTPAGHALDAWLDAFNSDDRARVEAYIKSYSPSSDPDSIAKWRADTGAYDLLEVRSNDKANVFFRVRARTTGVEEVGRLRVSEAEPAVVEELMTWRIPTGATWDPVPLDAAARHRVVDRVAGAFESFYVYPEIGKKMSAALREHEKRGEYRSMRYGIDLARKLTEDLQEIGHDKHAEVRFSIFIRPPESPADQSAAESRRLAANNCGFEKAEHLRPNIGYVKFDMFADAATCGPTASAAMNFVADSDALILDLRDNHGGGGGMGEFISSYLFDRRTHLSDVVDRAGNTPQEQEAWTLPNVPGRKFVGKPVFVLTSKHTFSAAEDFCYSLKNLQRATLIGETTAGGAHPTEIKPIDAHFSAAVPFLRSISPITKTNWQGTGVEPDVKVAADQALDIAVKLAVAEINKNRSNGALDN